MIKVSIILATYNWPQALNIILSALELQLNNQPQVELILADDGSEVETKLIVDKYKSLIKNFKHIWHVDDGFRKSKILNKAVAASSGAYLLFLDGDCIPFPDYISQQLKLAETGYFVAGNRVLLSRNFTSIVLESPEKLKSIFNWNIKNWFSAKLQKKVNKILPGIRLGKGKWRYFRSNNWKYSKGCNFALYRNDFLAINGFDESFSGWGHEDADLFIRLLHNGIKIKDGRFAVPVLHLWHKESDRRQEKDNYQRLMRRLKDKKFIKAATGVKQYL